MFYLKISIRTFAMLIFSLALYCTPATAKTDTLQLNDDNLTLIILKFAGKILHARTLFQILEKDHRFREHLLEIRDLQNQGILPSEKDPLSPLERWRALRKHPPLPEHNVLGAPFVNVIMKTSKIIQDAPKIITGTIKLASVFNGKPTFLYRTSTLVPFSRAKKEKFLVDPRTPYFAYKPESSLSYYKNNIVKFFFVNPERLQDIVDQHYHGDLKLDFEILNYTEIEKTGEGLDEIVFLARILNN